MKSLLQVFLAVACLLAIQSWAQVEAWEEPRYFDVVVSGSVRNDSNLFKLPTAESDTIGTVAVGLRMDRQYSLQRFQFQIFQRETKYDKNSQLDFRGFNYDGTWFWKVGTRLSGTLLAYRSEDQVPFQNTFGNSQRNVQVTERYSFNANGWVTGGWNFIAGITQEDQKSQQTVQIQPDFRSLSFNAGVRYLTPSGNSISVARRTVNGEYQSPTGASITDSDYREDGTELTAVWRLSETSALNGRWAWLDRDNSNPAFRDFSGPSTDASYTWTPTSQLNFNLSVQRSTGALSDPSFSYTRTDTLSFAPTWLFAPKASLNFRLARSKLQYKGTGSVPPTGPARSDTTDTAQLGLNWTPLRRVTLGASLLREERTSNFPGDSYNDTIGLINGSLTF